MSAVKWQLFHPRGDELTHKNPILDLTGISSVFNPLCPSSTWSTLGWIMTPLNQWCGFFLSIRSLGTSINTLRPRQNGRHFADDIFKCIFLNENVWIPFQISLKFLPRGAINNIPALVQIMAWRRSGDKPLSEPMMVGLLMHICVTRPQWVNEILIKRQTFFVKKIWLKLQSAWSVKCQPFVLASMG